MEVTFPGRAFALFFAVLALLMVAVPLFSGYGSFTGLDGSIGKVDHWDIWSSEDPFSAFIYLLGDMLCHQEEARSLILNGSQMPFCVRDFGIIAGALAGSIATDVKFFRYDLSDVRVLIIGVSLFIITLIEWAIEYSTSFDSSSFRGLTGFLSGIGIALIIQYLVKSQYNKIMES